MPHNVERRSRLCIVVKHRLKALLPMWSAVAFTVGLSVGCDTGEQEMSACKSFLYSVLFQQAAHRHLECGFSHTTRWHHFSARAECGWRKHRHVHHRVSVLPRLSRLFSRLPIGLFICTSALQYNASNEQSGPDLNVSLSLWKNKSALITLSKHALISSFSLSVCSWPFYPALCLFCFSSRLQEVNSMINKRLKDALFTDQWSEVCMERLSPFGYVLVSNGFCCKHICTLLWWSAQQLRCIVGFLTSLPLLTLSAHFVPWATDGVIIC